MNGTIQLDRDYAEKLLNVLEGYYNTLMGLGFELRAEKVISLANPLTELLRKENSNA